MNIISLGTTRVESKIQVLGERIENGGYRSFKYTIIILNDQRTRDDS
jgi:hypothetical protein